jgi:integrase
MKAISSILTGPKVRPRTNPSGAIVWIVDHGPQPDGSRPRETYHSKAEADNRAMALRNRTNNSVVNVIHEVALQNESLVVALTLLKQYCEKMQREVSFFDVVEFYVKHQSFMGTPTPLADAITEYLLSVEKKNARYVTQIRRTLVTFAQAYSGAACHDITSADVTRWLKAYEEAPGAYNHRRTYLNGFFAFAEKRQFIARDSNPVTNIATLNVPFSKPRILRVEECEALLNAAVKVDAESNEQPLTPTFAIGLFAGLRPEAEIQRLDWASIHWDANEIEVTQSKTAASERFIKMSDNLKAWLTPYRQDIGPVCPWKAEAYFDRVRKVRDLAGLALKERGISSENLLDWPQDAMRHCFGSYLYAKERNEHYTIAEMGHSGNLQIFRRHYKHRVNAEDAQKFWDIFPKKRLTAKNVA